ncbi:uncharacterized protein TRIVIDRAFT_68247 [Trichoderma virens Gv29-8]|uniref:Uncharacterized protein n=1 Tax=Hypocrea virens (strain Gv29-8 / FGSC 10586) TaxID=413071 RepID=G9N065_HYPVG|nr:uncharacterized protein TRIVIDRAFT_68247 [Trichoderma virens Gv29-8]EHK19747.1 hypothetical protein TRIVIDRAFT_68247 [Trichoderma virens Gv29-8]
MTSYMQNPLVLNPESSHLSYGFADAALLHAFFSLAGLYHDLSVGTKITPLSLMHRGETLRLVNERIAQTPLQLSDGTIGAVAALATFDMVDHKALVGICKDFNKWLFKEVVYESLEGRLGIFVDHGYCKEPYVGDSERRYKETVPIDASEKWGAVTYHDYKTTSSCGYLANAEVYDAEAVGAFEAIKLTRTQIALNPDIKEILLFLDNSAVLYVITKVMKE